MGLSGVLQLPLLRPLPWPPRKLQWLLLACGGGEREKTSPVEERRKELRMRMEGKEKWENITHIMGKNSATKKEVKRGLNKCPTNVKKVREKYSWDADEHIQITSALWMYRKRIVRPSQKPSPDHHTEIIGTGTYLSLTDRGVVSSSALDEDPYKTCDEALKWVVQVFLILCNLDDRFLIM